MRMNFAVIAALAMVLAPLSADPVLAQAAPPAAGTVAGNRHAGKLAAFLTPEQQAAFLLDAREQTKALSTDERKAWRQDQVHKLIAMSPAERQTFKTGLQAKWDALPDKRKQNLEQRIAARAAKGQ
jgi:hypothetical protein